MSEPVDLTNLRSITDGDRDMEQALFEEFVSSFEAGIAELQSNVTDSVSESWRKNAHALKGIAVNLGAFRLGDLCKKAQEEFSSTQENKSDMAGRIQEEYILVKKFLSELA